MPEVSKRPNLTGFIKGIAFYFYDKQDVDSYLYYKVFLFSLFLIIVLCSTYWFSCLSGIISAPYTTFIYKYPVYGFYPNILLSTVYGLSLFAARSPVGLKKLGSMQYSIDFQKNNVRGMLSLILFCLAVPLLIHFIPEYFVRYDLYNYAHSFREQSYTNLFIVNVIYLVFFQLFMGLMVLSSVELCRKIFSTRNSD